MSPVVGPSGPGSDSPTPRTSSMTSPTGPPLGGWTPAGGAPATGAAGAGAAAAGGCGSGLTSTPPPPCPPPPPGDEGAVGEGAAPAGEEPAAASAVAASPTGGSDVSAPTMSDSLRDAVAPAGTPVSGSSGPPAICPSDPRPPSPPLDATAPAASNRTTGATSETPTARVACRDHSLTMATHPW